MNQIQLLRKYEQPYIHVGVLDSFKFYDIKISGSFKLYDSGNKLIHSENRKNTTWRFKQTSFFSDHIKDTLYITESYNKEKLVNVQKTIRSLKTKIRVTGGSIVYNNEEIHQNEKYVLVCEEHGIKDSYKRYLNTELKEFNTKFVRQFKNETDEIEIFDSQYIYNFQTTGDVRVELDDQASQVQINHVEFFDPELNKTSTKNLFLSGNIKIGLNRSNRLDLINEIPTETYIHRVVFSELGDGMPLEFYKAMAVICRCEILNRIGQRVLGEKYDFHAKEDRLYFNPIKYKNELIDIAIKETKYEAMFYSNDICQAFVNIVCGGACENGNLVLDVARTLKYEDKRDSVGEEKIDFTNREDLKNWLKSDPDVLCNISKNENLPRQINIGKKYFRWSESITIGTIERQLISGLYEDIGNIIDIIVTKRGKSGRVIEVELLGTHRNIRIQNMERISKLFSKNSLPSTCFYIEKEFDDNGFLFSIEIYGAGYGHGVGLCKTGAAAMADRGATYKDILGHYFENAEIRQAIT